MTLISNMRINSIQLDCHVGWTESERAIKQVVTLDVFLQFRDPPKACETDILEDTICYDKLTHIIKEEISQKPIRLLEHLAKIIYELIKRELPAQVLAEVRVTKQPQLPHVKDGVSFCYGDAEK